MIMIMSYFMAIEAQKVKKAQVEVQVEIQVQQRASITE